MYPKQLNPYFLFKTIWEWSETVLTIKSKGRVCSKSSPSVVLSLFRFFSVFFIEKCYCGLSEELIVSHAVEMLKQWSCTQLSLRNFLIIVYDNTYTIKDKSNSCRHD